MKKILLLSALALGALCANAQEPLKVTIFGDSYSTFEGWLTPATNEPWYWTADSPYRDKNNDVT